MGVCSPATLLTAPTLSSTTTGATSVATTPTFSWGAVSGANRYWLMVARRRRQTTSMCEWSMGVCSAVTGTTTATSHTLPNAFPNGGTTGTLSAGTTYYWEVQG